MALLEFGNLGLCDLGTVVELFLLFDFGTFGGLLDLLTFGLWDFMTFRLLDF